MENIQYINIQTSINHNSNLSMGARLTYSILASHCHNRKITCNPPLSRIAGFLGRSVRSVIRYIQELIDAGIVIKRRRGSTSNEYTLKGLIAWDENNKKMVELTESNCNKEKKKQYSESENNAVVKAMSAVTGVIERVTNKRSTYKNYKKKEVESVDSKKDEYYYSNLNMINNLRQESLGLSDEEFEKLIDKEKRL